MWCSHPSRAPAAERTPRVPSARSRVPPSATAESCSARSRPSCRRATRSPPISRGCSTTSPRRPGSAPASWSNRSREGVRPSRRGSRLDRFRRSSRDRGAREKKVVPGNLATGLVSSRYLGFGGSQVPRRHRQLRFPPIPTSTPSCLTALARSVPCFDLFGPLGPTPKLRIGASPVKSALTCTIIL
jgi:hypothetical protein